MKKKQHPAVKSKLHPRNKHRQRYDFAALIQSCPELTPFVQLNTYQDESINFSDPQAVKMLNTALLKHVYQLDYWDIPDGYLCPPVPGRADYIHYLADLMLSHHPKLLDHEIPRGEKIVCLDIGVGANCVYPIIGTQEYGWSFIGTDIDTVALDSAATIIEKNPVLQGKIDLRLQENPKQVLKWMLGAAEQVDMTICNPPFHASAEEAQAASLRKVRNLKRNKQKSKQKHKGAKADKATEAVLNFGGQSHELWCEGGEARFVEDMIKESKHYARSCYWFTSLISKETTLNHAYNVLRGLRSTDIKTIPMGQGNKSSRMLAWTFLNRGQQREWIEQRWTYLGK